MLRLLSFFVWQRRATGNQTELLLNLNRNKGEIYVDLNLPLAEPSSVLYLRLCETLLPVTESVCVMECCFRSNSESKMIMVSFAVDSVELSPRFLGHSVLFRLLVSYLIQSAFLRSWKVTEAANNIEAVSS